MHATTTTTAADLRRGDRLVDAFGTIAVVDLVVPVTDGTVAVGTDLAGDFSLETFVPTRTVTIVAR